MLMPILAVVVGLVLLVWSADRFVDGSAAAAKNMGMPSLLIGMVIIGFGTSAPEMVVSVSAALNGNPGIALGNAYGSNIVNIGLVLGLTAFLAPIRIESKVLKKELPLLLGVTLVTIGLLADFDLSRTDAVILLVVFAGMMGWFVWEGASKRKDALAVEADQELESKAMPTGRAVMWLVIGLVVLVGSSRLLVWGAVSLATSMGVSDLIVGLTVVAIGTSLPELASSIAASRKGEQDLALGNVIGSNLFNTLAVVGLAGVIHPLAADRSLVLRDLGTVLGFTVVLLLMAVRWRGQEAITRGKGIVLLVGYVVYTGYLVWEVVGAL